MMNTLSSEPLVCLLRDASADDPYQRALEAAGFRAMAVPVLQFEFVNQDALRTVLSQPTRYGGLILTSPRAAEALGRVLEIPLHWIEKPVFVVGPKTATVAESVGLPVQGVASGSAEALADVITQEAFAQPLLFLCGNRRRDVIPSRLSGKGIAIKELCVYETLLIKTLDFSAQSVPNWMVVFSPSGVEAMQYASGFDAQHIRWAAIGETTAAALRHAGWHVSAVAAEPSPHALAHAILESSG